VKSNSITKKNAKLLHKNNKKTLQLEQRKWRKENEEDEDATKLHLQGTMENGYKDRNKLSLEGKSDTIL